MDLLTLKHEDFDLFISCDKFEGVYGKALRNIGSGHLTSNYSWTGGVQSVVLTDAEGIDHDLENQTTGPALFFDNTEYPIWVEFHGAVENARFASALQSDNEGFAFHARNNILSGFLNYGNEIGRSELVIRYQKDKRPREFTFGYEVLSTKLDYHEHWREIIEDIEAEYRMLSLDYLRRTFHGFSPDMTGETPELIWWNIFQEEQKRFIQACQSILNRPRHRLRSTVEYLRADRLKRVPASVENELSEHRREPNHLYRVEQQVQSNNTIENQFLKYALHQIQKKYEAIRKRILTVSNVSEELKKDMKLVSEQLNQLRHNPFFRTVGPFKGLNQESLVLQKATGYSQVYRTWNLLRRAYSLNDAMYRLQTKDIATLYEIWCFIEVSHIVREQMHLTDENVEQQNRTEMGPLFTYELGKGEQSRILFRKDGVELAELVYNPKHTENENDSVSMENLVVKTVPQKPDIVLQLTKNDLQEGMKMTYLFDAKYRIASRDSRGVDTPPDDAINQMHRYRDAIYYQDHSSAELKKEVIGGYILFPGDGDRTSVEVANFYKSIQEVNIGAFPLRPKDKQNRQLLEDFIQSLIGNTTSAILEDSIPQKGLYYTETEPKDAMYMILNLDEKVNLNMEDILSGKASSIIMGRKGMEESRDIQTVRYVAPIVNGHLIEGYYKVNKACWKQIEDTEYPTRIEFKVSDWVKLDVPAKYGLARFAFRGDIRTKEEFFRHCETQKIID